MSEWLFDAGTIQGGADRALGDVWQRHLGEYEDGTNDDPQPRD